MMRRLLLTLVLTIPTLLWAQSNIYFTNPAVDAVLKHTYNPAAYAATTPITDPAVIAAEIQARISPDSLRSHLERLCSFKNRNTGGDTSFSTKGIGAARRWVESTFNKFSQANENRLLSGYLQFDRSICNVGRHRNPVAVLPGADTSAKGFVLIEAHMDSRCAGACDSTCIAYGADDNGSGSALVIELARVLSKYTFRRTIVFMLTIGEEQGLYGAEALADYCTQQGIDVYAVLNNDIVGGIYCGHTSSPPSCPGVDEVDSLNVRLFSFGGYNSPHKQLARFIKLEYKEMLRPLVAVPMSVNLMSAEDRTGRGGDHIPFRQQGFTAMRFTAANEHGHGSPGPGYVDRQHTSFDSIGVDTDLDGDIDSLFVDFNYLGRNAAINANAAAMAALGPEIPAFTAYPVAGGMEIAITTQQQYGVYRVGVRTTAIDWDSVYTLTGTMDTLVGLPAGTPLFISAASVDANGTESLFSYETNQSLVGRGEPTSAGPQLLQNRPNPFDEQTIITVHMPYRVDFQEAHIRIVDVGGREIQRIPITLEAEVNEVLFHHGYHASGTYFYSLVIDGVVYETRKMVME